MRILILSDIHANLPALEAVLQDADPFDKIWCIGDAVGYGPHPNECVALLNEYDHLCVAGNHDWAVLERLDIQDFNPDARQAVLWTQKELTEIGREYLAQLPTRLESEDFTIVHGSPREPIWEYVLLTSLAATNFHWFNTCYCLVGHTHSPAIYQELTDNASTSARSLSVKCDEPLQLGDSRLIINPGSVGQPRDGDARASYVILDLEERSVTYRRVSYPIEDTQTHMRECDLSDRLVARLAHGW